MRDATTFQNAPPTLTATPQVAPSTRPKTYGESRGSFWSKVGKRDVQSMPVSSRMIVPPDLAGFVISAISPVRPLPTLGDDVQSFSRAVTDLVDAARDGIITEEESHALIGVLIESFARRRVTETLASIGSSTSHGVVVHSQPSGT